MSVPKNGKKTFTFILVILIWNSAGLLSISSYKTSTPPTPATNKPIFSSTAVRPLSLQPSYFRKELPIASHSTQTVTAAATISVPGLTGTEQLFSFFPFVFSVIMGVWAVAAVSTVIFMALYTSEDFGQRLNFKFAPHLEFRIIVVIGMMVNFFFCLFWEVCIHLFFNQESETKIICQVYLLDFVLFQKVLPWYKVKKGEGMYVGKFNSISQGKHTWTKSRIWASWKRTFQQLGVATAGQKQWHENRR